MKSFEYVAPDSIKEAVGLLGANDGYAEVLAGGTDLVTCLKQGLTEPQRLVSLKNISELKRIKVTADEITIGSMVTLKDLAAHPVIQRQFPSILTAINGVASTQIQTMGTVGGDLCQRPRCWFYRNGMGLFGMEDGTSLVEQGDNRYHAIFGNDGPALFVNPSSLGPVLQSLGATVNFAMGVASGAIKSVPISQFFKIPKEESDRETVLKANDVLESITIPASNMSNATYEIRHRSGLDWPYVTASIAFKNEAGRAGGGSIVLGHVAPRPWAAVHASNLLNGSRWMNN
jgi:xanthine dehydrogenase YagS FAD-binding subunit